MLEKSYADYAWEQSAALLAIDSPSGYTAQAGRLCTRCICCAGALRRRSPSKAAYW